MKDMEQWIKDNRSELDTIDPPADLWNDIRNDWKKAEPIQGKRHFWKAAAAVLLLCTVGLGIYSVSLNNEVNRLASLGDISEEYRQMEMDYVNQINGLEEKISPVDLMETEEAAWVREELENLEEINQSYRKDIGKTANQDRLVEALIDYYEKKIRLLEVLKIEIEKQKNERKITTNTRSI